MYQPDTTQFHIVHFPQPETEAFDHSAAKDRRKKQIDSDTNNKWKGFVSIPLFSNRHQHPETVLGHQLRSCDHSKLPNVRESNHSA